MIAGLLLMLSACPPAERPMIAEIFYDAIGADADHEFVELYNPTPLARSLEGLRLESGDGSEPGDWTLRWVGEPLDSLRAGARFVIGGSAVRPLPQVVKRLSLQNGPDAVRLVWRDGTVETVGYGAHEFDEYFCARPAGDVMPGQSLARVPDDARSGDNAADFRSAAPSPGRANQTQRDVAWVAGTLALDPEQPGVDETARLSGLLWNAGREDVARGELVIHVETRGSFGDRIVSQTTVESELAASDTMHIALGVSLPGGKQTLEARLERPGDERSGNDRDSISIRVGPGPLEITEIQFHPGAGEGEWVEVRNRSHAAIDLSDFTLSDRGATRARLEGPAWCEPGSLAVLAQIPAALMMRYPSLDLRRVFAMRPWPALNNSNDATGIADAVVLRETDGTLAARHDYSASGVPPAVPIEWRDGFWWPSLDPAGSPLAMPRSSGTPARPFELGPRRVRSGEAAVRLSWSLPWPRGSVAFELYDLEGGWVGRLLPETAVARRGEIEHRLSGLAAGLYVVVMRARSERGSETLVSSQALRVSGTAR